MAKKESVRKYSENRDKVTRKAEPLKVVKTGQEITFEYIKSNYFRVIHVDGAHGGITPKARGIQMAFFCERQPIPQEETFLVEEGRLEGPTDRKGRTGIIREVEVEVVMDLPTAKAIKDWLQSRIDQIDELQSQGGGR